jgi:hypothetical protein
MRSSIQNPYVVTFIRVKIFLSDCSLNSSLLGSWFLRNTAFWCWWVVCSISVRIVDRDVLYDSCLNIRTTYPLQLWQHWPKCIRIAIHIFRNVHLYTSRRGVWDRELQKERNIHQLQHLKTSEHPRSWTQSIDSDKDERFPHLWRTSEMD